VLRKVALEGNARSLPRFIGQTMQQSRALADERRKLGCLDRVRPQMER
jgi:hypothetical protein